MELLYKPDWEQYKENMNAWWAHEDFGRCAISVTARKAGAGDEAPPPLPVKTEDRWIDFDYLYELYEYRMKRTFFGGEAIPVWDAGSSQFMYHPAFLGSPIDMTEITCWVQPMIQKGELTDYDCNDFVIRPDNPWWNFSLKAHRWAADAAKGKAIPCIQTLGGVADSLAGMRYTRELLYDVMDCPEYVREFDHYLTRQWIEVHSAFYDIIKDGAEGSTTWPHFHVWAPGRYYITMCDFSYMISPKMFQELFLPNLAMQIDYLDYSIHHLDGVGAFQHADAILDIPKLGAMQVLPGDGKPSALHYMDVLRKVQNAGKNLYIGLPPEEVKDALETLSSRGLFISTHCDTEEEAKDLLKMAERLSKVRG